MGCTASYGEDWEEECVENEMNMTTDECMRGEETVQDRSESEEKVTIEEKKKRWRCHPMVRVLEIEGIRTTIVSFCSPSAYFPLLYLSMTPVGREDKNYFYEYFFNSLHYTMNEDEDEDEYGQSPIENLHLLRWHCESWAKMGFWKRGLKRELCILGDSTPYDSSASLEDLDFYFQSMGVSQWKLIRDGKDPERYSQQSEDNLFYVVDATIVAEDRGLIKIDAVESSCYNVICPILDERWDIADKYMRRGDIKKVAGGGIFEHLSPSEMEKLAGGKLLEHLSPSQLEKLVHTYDLWEVLEDVDIVKGKESCLLRGGILQREFMHIYHSLTYERIPIPLSQVPMNVVEDLFTYTLLRASEFEEQHEDPNSSNIIREMFFSPLKSSDEKSKPKSASATHRRYKITWIESIIASVRSGIGDPMALMNEFLLSPDLPKDGYVLPGEVYMMCC